MSYKFNPFTGNFDDFNGPDGEFTSIDVEGDITLDDGGTYTTTLQTITPTAARTISFPDATGTVALVGGSSGQVIYNNAGALAGISTMTFDGTSVTIAGRLINSYTSLASSPAKVFTGTWFTGGTSTTTKPHFLCEPTGTTSTAWSTSGTGIGVNAASAFAGNLLDLQVNGSSRTSVTAIGALTQVCTGVSTTCYVLQNTNAGFNNSLFYGFTTRASSTAFKLIDVRTNGGSTNVFNVDGSGNTTWVDGANFAVGTTTGTKIGTATTQKIGFFDKAPVVQPAAVANITSTATSGSLPTPDGSVTIADAAVPTVTELLEYCVELEAKLETALGRLRDLGLIAT